MARRDGWLWRPKKDRGNAESPGLNRDATIEERSFATLRMTCLSGMRKIVMNARADRRATFAALRMTCLLGMRKL